MQWSLPSALPLLLLSVFLVVVSFLIIAVDGKGALSPVYWNSSNSIFHSDNDDHIMPVQEGDSLDILCPHYTDGSTVKNEDYEYYIIYMVKRPLYEQCVINDTTRRPLIACNRPQERKKFTLLIRAFQPMPGLPDFDPGTDYFLISTSGGREFNMNNQWHGVCETHRMKIMLRVVEGTNNNNNNNNQNNNNDNNNNNNNANKTTSTTTTSPETHYRTWKPTPTPKPTRTTVHSQGGENDNGNNNNHNNNNDNNNQNNNHNNNNNNNNNKPTRGPTGKTNGGNGDDVEIVPGSDGFPDDDTVIHASDGPNMNTGIIDDDGMGNGCPSLHRLSSSTLSISLLLALIIVMNALWSRR